MKAQKLIPLLVVAAGLLAYHNSFTGPFILDDGPAIPDNPSIRHLWPIWPVLSPPPPAGVGGRPVLNFSYAINYAVGGTSVRGYHALDLAIHLLAALTLFGIVRRTLRQPILRERFGAAADGLALATAVLWAVHPVQTEAVTYLMQRGESLMGLFYLLTLYCFIRGTESPGAGLWFTLSIAACLLGMGTKEVMVTAPLMVLLYDRTFVAGSFRAAWTQRWRLYLGLGGTWLLLGYLMTGLQYRKVGYGLGITWQTYAFTECRVVVKYLWLALWPHPLVFDYGMEIIIRHAAEAVPYALILLLLIGGVVIALKRWPAIGFIGAWFFVLLAPSSSVVPVAAQPMAESRLYLPLAAVVVSAVIGIYAWLGRRSLVVFLVVAVGLGFLTAQRNADYSSDVSIWSDTLMKRPQNPRAHNNLGKALLEAGKVQEAIGQLKQALQIADLAEAHNNLGNALAQTGKIEEAIPHYERALQIWPNYFIAHNNLGNALVQVGRTQDAIKHYEQALRIRPDYAKAQNSLAWILATDGEGRFRNPVEAVRLAERACDLTARRDPNFLDTLAAAYAAQSRFTDAVRTAQEALKLAAVTGPNRLTNEIQTRLELYKAGHPYYEKPAASEPAQ